MITLENLKFDAQGLIPAIIQDHKDGQVLMVAYMNRESLQKTLETGQTWFYSRSRQTLWQGLLPAITSWSTPSPPIVMGLSPHQGGTARSRSAMKAIVPVSITPSKGKKKPVKPSDRGKSTDSRRPSWPSCTK